MFSPPEAEPDLDQSDTDWNLSLLQAASNGRLEDVETALENEAFIDYYCLFYLKYDGTALTLAARNGHLNIVKYLVEKGANPYLPYRGLSNTALEAAMETNCKDITNYLQVMMRLPEILNRIHYHGYTPLTHCIVLGYVKKIKEFIDLGADVCKMDRFGKNPLVYAVEKKSTEMVEKLLKRGAGACCASALLCALDNTLDEMAKLFIKSKPEVVNANLDGGFTPLTKALDNYNLEMVKYLIQNGADPTKQDRNGNFPLNQALEMNSIETAEMLISKQDNDKFPPELSPKLVKKFAENNRLEVFRFLIKNNWDIDEFDENGKTSLALSAAHQHLLLTEFLIENGADISEAEAEIEKFRTDNCDFDLFLESHLMVAKNEVVYNWDLTGTEQE